MVNHRRADVVIVGAGPAGYVAAIRLAQQGKKVVVVERSRVGGVCLNRGCIPVKALLHAAGVIRNAAEARTMGINFDPPRIDLVSLGSWKNRIVERLARGIEFLLKSNGVELVRGTALLKDERTVEVGTEDGLEITAERIVIATGSEPAVLAGLEVNHRNIIDSNSALSLVELPKSMIIVGAGAVGLEFATIFSRFGVKVTVLEVCDQILPGTDRELAVMLQRQMEREGIEFRLGVKGLSCAEAEGGVSRVCWENGAGLAGERILVAVGRRPLSGDIGLERLGLELDERGFIRTDNHLQTGIEGIYAIGDVRGGPLLAHKAMYEGILLAEILAGARKPVRARAVPMVVYTDPEFASVGLTPAEAERQGLKVRVSRVPASAVGRSLTLGRAEGMCKMVADEKTGRILGASILAPQADVLIAEVTVAVELGLTAAELGRVIHPHPTMSELVFEAGEALLSRAVHILNR
ncbi:MAG: dihydrolipoyl dehydrogenase [candidate division WOR-3 bacterium]|nr:dihydrolipoyl dehydrogenase [candidate division WOR-3 bacterium]